MVKTCDLATLLVATETSYLLCGRELGASARWLWDFDALDLSPWQSDQRVEFTSSRDVITTTSFWQGLLGPSLERLGPDRLRARFGCALTAPPKLQHDLVDAIRWVCLMQPRGT